MAVPSTEDERRLNRDEETVGETRGRRAESCPRPPQAEESSPAGPPKVGGAHITVLQARAFAATIEQLAQDTGRLRRRLQDDQYGLHLVDRLSLGLTVLDAFLWPTAGDLYRLNMAFSGDPALSAEVALQDADRRAQAFGCLLGEHAPDRRTRAFRSLLPETPR